jgi:hypothetical protein
MFKKNPARQKVKTKLSLLIQITMNFTQIIALG